MALTSVVRLSGAFLVHTRVTRPRRSEDLTFDKTDDKDAILIARLTAQLRCYVPEPIDETWGRLRHLDIDWGFSLDCAEDAFE